MNYGYGCDPCAQPYHNYPVAGAYSGGSCGSPFSGFALIVVLFILLIIIGASWCGNW